MDGIETLGHIAKDYPWTEIIMLTGFADFSTAIECLKKGAKDYLVKPIEMTELITRVKATLRAKTSERAFRELQQRYMSTFFHDLLGPLDHSRFDRGSPDRRKVGNRIERTGAASPVCRGINGKNDSARERNDRPFPVRSGVGCHRPKTRRYSLSSPK